MECCPKGLHSHINWANTVLRGFAYGIFYQNPERKYLPASTLLDFSKTAHYILQYQMLTGVKHCVLKLFYKKI